MKYKTGSFLTQLKPTVSTIATSFQTKKRSYIIVTSLVNQLLSNNIMP